MKKIGHRHGQKQGRPWLVSDAPEQIGRPVWERVCDERDLRAVRALEAEVDAEILAAGAWSDRWWRLMRQLDRVRAQRIRLEVKLGIALAGAQA